MNVPSQFFAKGTLRSWGGSILEILVVGVMAIAALAAAASIYVQQDAARTPVTTLLLALDVGRRACNPGLGNPDTRSTR
jgi:phage-related minor tail protein